MSGSSTSSIDRSGVSGLSAKKNIVRKRCLGPIAMKFHTAIDDSCYNISGHAIAKGKPHEF